MPRQVGIEVFRTGKTVVDREEVDRWMQYIGATEFVLPDDETVTDPALLIALAGKRCYMSFEEGLNPNVTRIRKDYAEYFENILASGHGSVLEHSVYNFAIEGVSRVFTAEMNRHRAGWAISEGSLRFIRFGKSIPYWVPDSIQGESAIDRITETRLYSGLREKCETNPEDEDALRAVEAARREYLQVHALGLEDKRQLTRRVFVEAFGDQEVNYRMLEAIWADELAPESKFHGKKQVTSMMRRIIGLGVATGGVWSGNVRALRHVITMRASAQAEEEMLHVFSKVAKVMADKEPHLFGDFTRTEGGFWVPKYLKV